MTEIAAPLESSGRGLRAVGSECARPTVFIVHASDLLTDHLPNGDGLVAHGFIRELAERGHRLHIAVYAADLHQALPENVTLHPIPRRFASRALDRLHYTLEVRRLLRRLQTIEQVDLAHQMNPVFAGLSLGLLGCGVPVVLGTFVPRWPHGQVSEATYGWLSRSCRSAVRWLVCFAQESHAAALLITTPAALDRVTAPPLVRHKTFLLPHGIDTTMFSPQPSALGTGDSRPSILFYSHLLHRKGVFVLVEAFRLVARELPSCRLVLVGRGEDEPELRRAIAVSGCVAQIELRGMVPRTEAPALFRAHTVYCLPSFGEPYGMTALEAMACGRPLVVTAAGGLAHIVPEEGGLRVAPGDPGALAEALLTILRSPELQRRMGAANRAHVERYHSWRRVLDDLETIYARSAFPIGRDKMEARP